MMRLLLDKGAEAHHRDSKVSFIRSARFYSSRLSVAVPALLHYQDGATAFMIAARENHVELMRMLHPVQGVDINALDTVSECSHMGRFSTVVIVLSVSLFSQSGHSALMMAAGRDRADAVHQLIGWKANLELTNQVRSQQLYRVLRSGFPYRCFLNRLTVRR
jgi:ankyrin repeat protein